MSKNRRGSLVIDKELQARMVAAVSWPAAIGLSVMATLLGAFCSTLTELAMSSQVDAGGVFWVLISGLLCVVASVAYFLFNCLKISHRIAGPLHNITTTLNRVREGETDARARLRDGDFLFGFADGMNDFLNWAEPHLPAAAKDAVAKDGASKDTGETAQPVDPAESAVPAESH